MGHNAIFVFSQAEHSSFVLTPAEDLALSCYGKALLISSEDLSDFMRAEFVGDELRLELDGRLTAIFHCINDGGVPTVAELTKFIYAPGVNVALRVQG